MITPPFGLTITSTADLRALVGEPSEVARRKQIGELDDHCRAFIGRSPFLLMATADAAGRCDVSPKGDRPGFVLVLGRRHLVVPDRPGNRRLDGMQNLLANPHLGLIFLIPGKEETLRVNGRGCIVRDPSLLERMAVDGKAPHLAVGVEVEEVFLHCAKALKRSALWRPQTWPDPAEVPAAARMLLDHARPEGMTLEQMERRLQHGYETQLY